MSSVLLQPISIIDLQDQANPWQSFLVDNIKTEDTSFLRSQNGVNFRTNTLQVEFLPFIPSKATVTGFIVKHRTLSLMTNANEVTVTITINNISSENKVVPVPLGAITSTYTTFVRGSSVDKWLFLPNQITPNLINTLINVKVQFELIDEFATIDLRLDLVSLEIFFDPGPPESCSTPILFLLEEEII